MDADIINANCQAIKLFRDLAANYLKGNDVLIQAGMLNIIFLTFKRELSRNIKGSWHSAGKSDLS
jgi:hypothetical protein